MFQYSNIGVSQHLLMPTATVMPRVSNKTDLDS